MRPTASALLRQLSVPAALMTNCTNIRYLTGADVSTGYVLAKLSGYTLFVDGRYTEAAAKSAFSGVTVTGIEDLTNILQKIKECGFESDVVTVDQLRYWKRKFKSTKFVQKSQMLRSFRRQKDDTELSHIKKAQRITQQLLDALPDIFTTGMTEQEVALWLESEAINRGADGLSFDPIVAFGTHTSRPHHHPTNRKLQPSHLIQIDVGVRYRGYCADKSRVYFLEQPTKKQQLVYEAVQAAKEAAASALTAGISNHTLDQIAREILTAYDLNKYFIHSLGHGVGLDIHEGVSLSERAPDEKLLSGEVVTIEPGVYIPGQFGIRLEDEYIVE